MSKSASIIVLVAFLVLGGFGAWYFMARPALNTVSDTSSVNAPENQVKGTVYFTITDAALDMENITAVEATIDRVEVFSSAQGWIVVSQTPKTFSLLELKEKNQAELLAKAEIPAGAYSQVRLHMAKVLVTEAGQVKEAKMPSNELKIMGNIVVGATSNFVGQVDILADRSVHKTGNGQIIFAPVVQLDSTTSATVQVNADNVVTVTGGRVGASVNAGMDVDGSVKLNFQIDPKVKLNINAGVIEIK